MHMHASSLHIEIALVDCCSYGDAVLWRIEWQGLVSDCHGMPMWPRAAIKLIVRCDIRVGQDRHFQEAPP